MSDLSEREELKDGVWWFDSDSSRRRRAVLIFYKDRVCAETEDGARRDSRIQDVEISSRLGAAPRRIVFADGVSVSAEDNNFIDAMLKKRGKRRAGSLAHFIESRWHIIAAAAAGAALLAAGIVFYAVPAAASVAARAVPQQYLAEITEEVYEELQKRNFIAAGKLPPEEKNRIENIFAEIAAGYADSGYDYRLRAHDFEPNAFAFPDGLVVVSDKLAEILTGDELRAVFAHEIGHVELRHGMRSVLESAGTAAFLLLATGDISGIVAGGALLANLKYSRDHEREADCFAYHVLRRRGLSGALIGEALRKMETAYVNPPVKSAEKNTNNEEPPDKESSGEESADEESQNEESEDRKAEINAKPENTKSEHAAATVSVSAPEQDNEFWRGVLLALSTHPSTEERSDLAAACGETE